MKIHKKIGSKERLFEMFENVNNFNLKENSSNEIGTDSAMFHMLISYVSRNYISDEIFNVGELKVQIEAEPTTWEDVKYMPATHMQPEEGGSPEDVKGEITDIVIWDKDDNEYRLSQDAFAKLNQHLRGFDGEIYDDLAEKASNKGVTEGGLYDTTEEKSGNDLQSYLENNYNKGSKTIPNSIVIVAANKFNVSNEVVRKTAIDIIKKNIKGNVNEIDGGINPTITYSYNDKGIFIPKGHEGKRIGIISVEVPAFSGNEVISVVEVRDDGSMGKIYKKAESWDDAKKALVDSII